MSAATSILADLYADLVDREALRARIARLEEATIRMKRWAGRLAVGMSRRAGVQPLRGPGEPGTATKRVSTTINSTPHK